MKAYSLDLRQRIVMAYDAGMMKAEIARTFRVSRPTVTRYVAQWQDTGHVVPKPIPGRRAYIAASDYPALVAQLTAVPDATLQEHCQAWERTHGIRVSIATMQRAITATGWTRKKRW